MREWQSYDSRAHHLCDALLQSLERKLKGLDQLPSGMTHVEKEVAERPIGIMLVIMQRLKTLESPPQSQSFVKEGDSRRRRLWDIFDITHLWQELLSFALEIQDAPQAALLARRLCPFLQRFHLLAHGFLSSLATWSKSLFKLASVLVTLGQNLAANGFCKPEESGDQTTQQDVDMKADGTGVGEGQGDKDISKDIEDESQVEGLQDQETRSKEDKEDKDESGLEMDQDFDGELESVQGSDEKESNEGSEEVEEEVDEKMDELDPADPDAVDEKMWGVQDAEKDDKEDLQSKESSKGESNESQMAAKEENLRQQRQDTDNEHASPEDDQEIPSSEGGDPDTENLPNEAGAQVDDHIQEEEVLNLPDGLDLELEAESKDPDLEADDQVSEEEGDRDKSRVESDDDDDGELSVDGRMETSPGEDVGDQGEEDTPPEITAKPDETMGGEQKEPQGKLDALAPIDHGAAEAGSERNQPMDVDDQDSRPEEASQ
jgi:midasin